jgi:hypothetical protein
MKPCTEGLGTGDSNSKPETALPPEFQRTVRAQNSPQQTTEMSSFPERERRVYPQRWQRDDEF